LQQASSCSAAATAAACRGPGGCRWLLSAAAGRPPLPGWSWTAATQVSASHKQGNFTTLCDACTPAVLSDMPFSQNQIASAVALVEVDSCSPEQHLPGLKRRSRTTNSMKEKRDLGMCQKVGGLLPVCRQAAAGGGRHGRRLGEAQRRAAGAAAGAVPAAAVVTPRGGRRRRQPAAAGAARSPCICTMHTESLQCICDLDCHASRRRPPTPTSCCRCRQHAPVPAARCTPSVILLSDCPGLVIRAPEVASSGVHTQSDTCACLRLTDLRITCEPITASCTHLQVDVAGLIDDAWAIARAGRGQITPFLDLTRCARVHKAQQRFSWTRMPAVPTNVWFAPPAAG